MKTVVVDASVALRWFLPDEERGDKALALLESYVRGEIRMVVPSLLGFEVLNGLLIASRRGRLEIATALRAYRGFQALGLEVADMGADGPEILRIAAQTGLTAYDAAYIALARREKADLLTNDARLSQAAEKIPL
ncbi:MAG: type II toxin-antitoxin system VapC family toxin [Candidatus Atribacteria bacterium]|nr:type II toxin-antitoxin system VapC family toxin [Candidatus Atribacteria bacterium]